MMRVILDIEAIAKLRERRIFFEADSNRIRLQPGQMLQFSETTTVEPYCGIFAGSEIPVMGSFSYSWSPLGPGWTIGRYCSIAHGVKAPGPRHPHQLISNSSFTYDRVGSIFHAALADSGADYDNYHDNPQKPPPIIGNDVWIGLDATIMPGVRVGNGAVIAARSVVTKDVPDFAIMGGNPAKIIRFRFKDSLIEKINAVAWWQYRFDDFDLYPLDDVERFVEMVGDGALTPYQPEPISLAKLLENWVA